MSTSVIISLLLAAPIIVAVVAWWVIGRLKQPALDQPFDLMQLWRRSMGASITPRQVLKVVSLCFPLAVFSSLGLFGVEVIFYVLAGLAIWKIVSWHSALPAGTQSILTELEATAATLGTSRASIEHLLQLVATKAQELEEKSAEKLALEKVISEKMRESAEYQSLTDQQKDLLAAAVTRSQRRGAISTLGIIIGSITLNVVATIVWTLLGNPGKEELMVRIQGFVALFTGNG